MRPRWLLLAADDPADLAGLQLSIRAENAARRFGWTGQELLRDHSFGRYGRSTAGLAFRRQCCRHVSLRSAP